MKRFTLEEIAKIAGVSRATVSRVVNGYPHIRPEIRERVQAVITQTGFKPNALARSLVSNRSNIIGLIIPSVVQKVFTDPYFAYLIHGIAQSCNANGLILSLYLFHSLEEEHNVIQTLVGTGLVDGMIVTADRHHQAMVETLIANQIPLVLIGEPEDRSKISYVDTDNVAGGYMATKHLIDVGYRRIGIIAAQVNKSSDLRLEGYRRALNDHSIKVDKRLMAYGNFSQDSGYEAVREILPYRPDAIFATNDAMALGSMRALREANISVPDDIGIIGYDDFPLAQQAEPPLTTIRQPVQQSGIEAVEMLIELLNHDIPAPLHRLLDNTLIVRSSTRNGARVESNE